MFAQSAPAATVPEATRSQAYFEFLLARRLEAQGDSAGALEALKRAQALDPQSAEILAETAGLYARQNKGVEAVEAAERALKLDPKNTEANRLLGLLFAAWSDGGVAAPPGRTPAQLRAAAIEHLTRILETPAVATDLNLQLTLARLHLRAGRADRAVPILESIVSQAPFATEPYTLLAEARLSLGRTDAAIEALQMAAELNPRHYVSLGELYERQGRWAAAAAAYEQAVKNLRGVGRDVRLRWAAALLNMPDGQGAEKARAALKDYLMTSPQDARGLFLLASANLQTRDFAAAEEIARKLLALDPTSLPGLRALSAALVGRSQFRAVIDLLMPFSKNAAARSKGRESEAALLLAQLAHAQSELGEHESAIASLTAAIASDPLSAPALNSLGYTLAERGERLPEAVGFIERALKVEPDNPSYLDSLGWALYKQGKVDEAEPHLRRAAEALPTQSVIQDHFGDVLARRGRFTEAIRAWERALSGDGTDIDRNAVEKKIKDAKGRQQ
ncbi:MAG: tetratricopeptide repeat protein [Vicinamibacterales bacterium]